MDKVLIIRRFGGFGDALVHRQIIRDVGLAYDAPVAFACPIRFHPILSDHPYISELIDYDEVQPFDYSLVFDTSDVCARTEVAHLQRGQQVPQRADIWAAQCGVILTDYDPHFRWAESELEQARATLGDCGCLFCPVSANDRKDLDQVQREFLFEVLDRAGYRPRVLHHQPLGLPQFSPMKIRQWMALIAVAPLVVGVDSSQVHMAGLARVPQVAIFKIHPGKVVTKHYTHCEVIQTTYGLDALAVLRAIEKALQP